MLTGLRLTEGLDLEALRRDVGEPLSQALLQRAHKAIARGRPLQVSDTRICVPGEALHLLDALVLDLV